jgi:hypothetical protein
MREKIWTEATLGKDSSDPDENRRLSAVEQIFSDHNLDYDLWIWRAGFATMMISQVTYPLAIFSSISHLWFATLVAHWLSRRWIPWWQYLRFRNEKISGGEDWTFTESTVFYVRLLTILSRTFSVPYALPTGLCVEAMVSLVMWYHSGIGSSLNCLRPESIPSPDYNIPYPRPSTLQTTPSEARPKYPSRRYFTTLRNTS